ncbi:PilZ domain-containing protein [Hydrogenoanaerobacterium saccharovorans]|uniref:PilZ domain-containing protein n=1 Tax=Hydrogenoanaerobacterium saccharovorans TaxID=474960 RepID=A0A1H7ZAW9_9FIRM|nr:PilZ domain-containing protein [Hydrogenoanaerobacterium saccharovorans]RPF48725.1 PilZ domain-containing protein [Hydrogenoanaerobacterium saccharovorans]SEM55361.1 PilZ domain-containing protein [Hydrogenoanaerobacterium saccharovorans]
MLPISEKYAGSVCVLKSRSNDLLASGVIGKITSGYVDVIDVRGEMPLIAYNTLVKMNIYNSVLGFRVLIGRMYISAKNLARITDVTALSEFEKRLYFRVNAKEKAQLLISSEPAEQEPRMVEIELVDVSLNGMQFTTTEKFDVEDVVFPILQLPDGPTPFNCIIRRIIREGDESKIGYGCEFIGITDRQSDMLYKYILNKQNKQNKKKKKYR